MFNKKFMSSLILMLVISIIAKYIALLPGLSIIGHLVIALILGMLLQVSGTLKDIAKGGSHFISNKFLRLGIILMGFRLNLIVLANHGVSTILLAIVVIVFTILIIYFMATYIGVEKKLALLSACGCGVCGAAAVLGVSPTLDSSEDDEVIAIAAVAILGTLFTLIIVLARPFLGLTEIQYGVLAGGSLHEIAHAVAAGNAGGPKAEEVATIVKLSRVLMLAPLSLILSFFVPKNANSTEKVKIIIPWFMFGFILSSAIGTYIALPKVVLSSLVSLAYIFLGMAMAALGVNVHFKIILEKGKKIFAVAFLGSAMLLILVFILSKIFF